GGRSTVSPRAQPAQAAITAEQLQRLEQRRADRCAGGGHPYRTERLARLERQIFQQRDLERYFDLRRGPLPDVLERGDRGLEHRGRIAAQLLGGRLFVEGELVVVEELQQVPRVAQDDDAGLYQVRSLRELPGVQPGVVAVGGEVRTQPFGEVLVA